MRNADWREANITSCKTRAILNLKSAFRNRWICSSAESERDSAKVEVARSNRARSTKPFSIFDCRLPIGRRALTVRINRQLAIGNGSAGVAQLGGGASLRN